MTASPGASILDLWHSEDWDADMPEARLVSGEEARLRRERLPAWRAALRTGVTAVSPALIDMAGFRGVDLARAAGRLRPPDRWRAGDAMPAFGGLGDVWPRAPDPRRRVSPYGGNGRTPQAPRVGAVPPGHDDAPFVVALDGATLAGCARVGDATFLTHRGLLQIWFERSLPDTVMMAAVGMAAGRVVAHPVLTDRPYPIVRSLREGPWTVFEIETGLVPFAMAMSRVAGAAPREKGGSS